MPTTKTISCIGETKFELVKGTYDAFRFTVDDNSTNAPKTVMYISSEPTGSGAPSDLSSSGRVTMSNIRTEGATSTSSADVDGDIGIGGKILIREGTGTGTATRAAIYAEKDTSDNHRLILDPYREDDSNPDTGMEGTVYIRGSLIVEGNKTILDTAEHITSENLLGINAVKDSNGDTTGGAATTAGIHVYSGNEHTQFLYNFTSDRWRTAAVDGPLKDLEAKDVYIADLDATGEATVNVLTVSTTASISDTLTLSKATGTGLVVEANASVRGILGAESLTLTKTAGTGVSLYVTGDAFIGGTLEVTDAVTLSSTLDVTDALTASSGDFGTGAVTAGTFTGNLTGDVTGKVSDISNFSTTDLTEGTNLYYTDAKADARIAAANIEKLNNVSFGTTPVLNEFLYFDGSNWANVAPDTDHITESGNLYYTDARARGAITIDVNDAILQYNNETGILSTNLSSTGLSGLGDVTLTSVGDNDILTYIGTKWVNSNSLTISGETNLGPFALSKRNGTTNPDYHSIIFTDNRASSGNTTHRIFDVEQTSDTSGNPVYKRNLGDDDIHVVSRGVSARTIGNIVPVELTSLGGRSSTKTITATATSVPLHADILNYYSGKTFAAGKCVAALTNGTHASVAMFSFSVCGTTQVLTMVLDQEVHSNDAVLSVDYNSSGTIDLKLGTAASAIYCVKVLPIMTSDSITEQV
jgi:hypothetical protein